MGGWNAHYRSGGVQGNVGSHRIARSRKIGQTAHDQQTSGSSVRLVCQKSVAIDRPGLTGLTQPEFNAIYGVASWRNRLNNVPFLTPWIAQKAMDDFFKTLYSYAQEETDETVFSF